VFSAPAMRRPRSSPISEVASAVEQLTRERELKRLSLTDPLTGLLNPRGFRGHLDHRLETAARREMREETAIELGHIVQLGAYGAPGRDPRGHTVGIAYLAAVGPGEVEGVAGDDAADVRWFAAHRPPSLAFDHGDILRDARRELAALARDREQFCEKLFGRRQPSYLERLLQAANVCGVDLFVNQLPQGFDTQVGESGAFLSGGQRQAIALGRAVLLNEPLLILDEPTNSFDNTTESTVKKRLYDYTRDKTLLLVTHKAPMLDLVERLIVMDEGKIVMDGPKNDVLNALKGTQNA